MTKVQDKLLQRVDELKEQCALEKAAKAQIENTLRTDIEERDCIISTLNIKVILLYLFELVKYNYLQKLQTFELKPYIKIQIETFNLYNLLPN